jgi:hypothetical protein
LPFLLIKKKYRVWPVYLRETDRKQVQASSTIVMEHNRREGELSHPGYPHKLLEAQDNLSKQIAPRAEADNSDSDDKLRRGDIRLVPKKNMTTRLPLEGHRTPLKWRHYEKHSGFDFTANEDRHKASRTL